MSDTASSVTESEEPSRARTVSERIRTLRRKAGLSHSQLANLAGYSRQYISRAEQASQGLPSAELVAAIDEALDAKGELSRLRAGAYQDRLHRRGVESSEDERCSAQPEAPAPDLDDQRESSDSRVPVGFDSQEQTAIRDSLALLSSLTASQVDSLVLEDIEGRGNALVTGYYRISLAAFRSEVIQVRRRAHALLQMTGKLSQKRQIYVCLATLTAMLAEASFALGEQTDSHCGVAIELANEAEHLDLVGWVRGTQAQIALHTGNPAAAVRYARSGQDSPVGSTAAVRSATYLARASARLGDRAGALEAWRSAERAWSQCSRPLESSVFSLSPDYIECCELTMLAWLGEATPVAGARNLSPTTTPTVGRAIREIDLGHLLIADGEIDEAVNAAYRTLAIGQSRWTTPLQDRFQGLLQLLLPYRMSAVVELQRRSDGPRLSR